ncbi:hypothetical protein M427DRAFT_60666 [Gonapodya prolifera JEL478]|uniref:Uncharacterized protein n=1 Tax=Gonapodya prolifera (strain JEL478) TaxID=1344416 RepID=A0A139A4A1_GONPJ|nr:hypothetical protein M427DRAFT_60666 [Gonapodya prolifera JEL478]|eukprot:KXS11418.1 hypothetical protein M427DRAFT_60666 [Gonapodya prolifera JEL478]
MRPTGRKLLCALVEISKRVVVEVRIEGSGDFPVDYIRMSWKGQLGELECSEVLKSGAVMLRRS